jgi:hypothetical protein
VNVGSTIRVNSSVQMKKGLGKVDEQGSSEIIIISPFVF